MQVSVPEPNGSLFSHALLAGLTNANTAERYPMFDFSLKIHVCIKNNQGFIL